MTIPGARGATLVDCSTGLAVAAVGGSGVLDRHEDAAGTTDVVRVVLASPALSASPAGDDVQEIIVSGEFGYHLLVCVGRAFGAQLFLHVVLDRDSGNLALARLRVREIVDLLAGGRDDV
ncbi:hypothetical protein [Actinomadura oligospora]|uniref:hypothetical protein n=1 Tax=Actinomadura oligospora TaxID=111804 RepID=UPI000478D2E4|nr:hypothetical protein [Actinomadura oligospora]